MRIIPFDDWLVKSLRKILLASFARAQETWLRIQFSLFSDAMTGTSAGATSVYDSELQCRGEEQELMKTSIKPIKIANIVELSPVGIIAIAVASLAMATVTMGAQFYTYKKEVEGEMAGTVSPEISEQIMSSRKVKYLDSRRKPASKDLRVQTRPTQSCDVKSGESRQSIQLQTSAP